MPLSKRFVADAQLYATPDIYEASTQDNLLRDISSAGNLGALHQISFLSLYAFEMFDNLSRLAEDVGSRILNATDRSSHLIDKLVQVESRIQKTVLTKVPQDENQLIHQKKQTMKFLKIRSAQHIPSALNKQTNCAQISGLYGECTLPPQFWKLEALTFDDCLIRYSNPGLFFEEWLKVELLKQEQNRLERKRLKKERKLAKKKRREEEALALADGNLNPDQVRRKGLKDKKRKNKDKSKAKDEAPEVAPQPAQPLHATPTPPHRGSTTSNLFAATNNYNLNTLPPSPAAHAARPPTTHSRATQPGKLPSKPPPSKPPPSKPPPSKPPPSKPPPSKPPPSSKPPSKPPPKHRKPASNPPAAQPPAQATKPQPKVTPNPVAAPVKPSVTPAVRPAKVDVVQDKPPPPGDRDEEDPPPDDDPPEDLPPPEVEEDGAKDLPPADVSVLQGGGDDEPPLDDEDPDPPGDIEDDADPDQDGMDDEPPDDELPPPEDDEDPIMIVDEDEDEEAPPPELTSQPEEDGGESELEDEDAFEELPPAVMPVVLPVFQPPKRKQSILMIGRDKKKMAEEASANLQRLGITVGAGGADEDFNDVMEAYTCAEERARTASDAHRDREAETVNLASHLQGGESQRRKSFLTSNLNLGLDFGLSGAAQGGNVEEEGQLPYTRDGLGERHQESYVAEEWGGHERRDHLQEEDVYDQHSQLDEEPEAENYDEYYQDGYFWNGTEWVVADDPQQDAASYAAAGGAGGGGYEHEELVEEAPVEEARQHRQSALSLFGGGDVLASIRQGNSLRKAEPLAPKEVSARDGMLSMIKMGGTTLKKADLSAPRGKLAPKPDQSDAIARLLSNRAQIAGSDSDSSDSDDSDSDDSYF